jgi:hypothetical protein
MASRRLGLLFSLLVLVAAVAVVLGVDGRAGQASRAHAEAFQRLVGGVGFGPAVDLSRCAFGFDPRLDGSCQEESGPIPGGRCFCPRHACSLFFYPPPNRGLPVLQGNADGALP